jgi:hypothetical protein
MIAMAIFTELASNLGHCGTILFHLRMQCLRLDANSVKHSECRTKNTYLSHLSHLSHLSNLSAIELAKKKIPRHNSRMSLVQSGGILFYP